MKKSASRTKGWLSAGQYAAGRNTDAASVAAYAVVASTIFNSDATITKR